MFLWSGPTKPQEDGLSARTDPQVCRRSSWWSAAIFVRTQTSNPRIHTLVSSSVIKNPAPPAAGPHEEPPHACFQNPAKHPHPANTANGY